MPIISVEIMKTIHERELQKNNKRKTNKGRKEQEERNYSKSVKLNDFVVHLS